MSVMSFNCNIMLCMLRTDIEKVSDNNVLYNYYIMSEISLLYSLCVHLCVCVCVCVCVHTCLEVFRDSYNLSSCFILCFLLFCAYSILYYSSPIVYCVCKC